MPSSTAASDRQRRFAVSPSAAAKLLQRVRATASTAPAKVGAHRRAKREGHEDDLRDLAAARKGITLAEIKSALLTERRLAASVSTIWAMLRKLGLRHKRTR